MWARLARAAVRGVDAVLRRGHGVYEFSAELGCLLRVAMERSERDVALSDGTFIARGARIGELHLWNERLPAMDATGADVRWAVAMRRGLAHSLQLLDAHIQDHPAWDGVPAFRGETTLDPQWGDPSGVRVLGQLGLELMSLEQDSSLRRFTHFWENLYTWWLMWAFAPGSLRSKRLWRMRRHQVWISRRRLLSTYGASTAVRKGTLTQSIVDQCVYR